LAQINAGNFADLEVKWIWRSDNFGPNVDYFFHSTPRRRCSLSSGDIAELLPLPS